MIATWMLFSLFTVGHGVTFVEELSLRLHIWHASNKEAYFYF